MKTKLILSILVMLMVSISKGQTTPSKSTYNNLIQFSGIVLDQDSLTPIPYVAVMIKGTNRGTKSDYYGFFNLVVNPGDEIEFLSLIHKTRSYKIADSLKQKYYYAIQVLTKDTVKLEEVTVFPWPSREDFKRAFLALDLNDTDFERADKNLAREDMTYLERNATASPTENYKYMMQNIYTKVYTAGQSPSISLLNPVAWAQFIKAWRDGKYKSASKKKKYN
jgi:CarboxypepD_reg-like domain